MYSDVLESVFQKICGNLMVATVATEGGVINALMSTPYGMWDGVHG